MTAVTHIHRMVISSDEWGDLKVLRPIPIDGDPWGPLAPLRDTKWAQNIPVVSGYDFSHALHGRVTPLMRAIGPDPRFLLKKLPDGECRHQSFCLMRSKFCVPGGKKTPDCWRPREGNSDLAELVSIVVLAWCEGRYVVVVEGEEFSI